MKQNKLPTWLCHLWRKRLIAIGLTSSLVLTSANSAVNMIVHAEEESVVDATEISETFDTNNSVSAQNEETEVKPPVGLVLNSNQDNFLSVVYGPSGTEGVDHYKIYIDGEVLLEPAYVAYYEFDDIEAGEHTIQVTAVLNDGSESPKSGCESTIVVLGGSDGNEEQTEEDKDSNPEQPEEGKDTVKDDQDITKPAPATNSVIAISESLDSVSCGEDVILTFHDNSDFSDAIETVTVNGTSVDFSTTNSSITIAGSNFPTAGIYQIQVHSSDYDTAAVYQTVYEDDVWELVFSDEFEGTSLNTDIWSYQNGTGAEYGLNGWGNDEEQYYSSDNITVGDGTMTIQAKKEARDGKSYTSGRIRSLAENNTGFSTTYGRVEAKIKMPAGNGIWPAFWMLPSTDEYGTWASNGEIDIMEARGRLTNQVLGTIHYGETWPNNKSSGVTYNLPDDGSITDYHVYALEWDVGYLAWYVDGVKIHETDNWYSKGVGNTENFAFPAPFDEAFHIVLNMAVGGTFDGGQRPSDNIFENDVTMDVDYVRVYRNNTPGYYDREVTAPEQETDTELFAKYTEQYADQNGNFVTDTAFTNIEAKDSILSNEITNVWNRHWYYLIGNYGAVANYTVNAKQEAVIDISNGGSQNYSVQMVQHLPLVKGYTYELSFDAYASKERNIIAKLAGDDNNGWGSYSNAFTPALTTEPTHYSYSFTMGGESDETARLEFNLGLDTGKVFLSNVCLKAVESQTNEDTEKEPLENGNHIYNGTFDQGNGKLAYWSFNSSAASSNVNSEKKLNMLPGELTQSGIQLLQNDTYRFSLQGKGDSAHVTVLFESKDGLNTYAEKDFTFSDSLDTYDFDFTMPQNVTDKNSVVKIITDSNVILDNISLIRTTDNNVSYDNIKIYPLNKDTFSSGIGAWTEYTDGGAACQTAPYIAQEGDNSFIVAHGAKGGQTYFNMLMHDNISLVQGTKYTLSFRAKASSEQPVEVKIENASYTSTLAQSFVTSTEWTDYSFDFKSSLAGDTTLKFLLAGVNANTTIAIDDVMVKVTGVNYSEAPVLTSNGIVKLGKNAVLSYSNDDVWESASKRVFINNILIPDSQYYFNTTDNTVTILADTFKEGKTYTIKVIADGYDYASAKQTIVDGGAADINGNIAPAFSEWEHYVGTDWAWVYSNIVSQSEHNITLTSKAENGWNDTAWGLQLIKDNIPVTEGYPYSISFTLTSSQDKKVAFKLEGSKEIYEIYELKAGIPMPISIHTEEMTSEFVKAYFAMGAFPGETKIDTIITISDFSIISNINTGEDTEPDEPTPPIEETPDVPSDGDNQNPPVDTESQQPVNNTPVTSENSSANNQAVKRPTNTVVSDKLANMILDDLVALAPTPGQHNTQQKTLDLVMLGTDGILTARDLNRLGNESLSLNAIFSHRLAFTLRMAGANNTHNLNLNVTENDGADYGQGFSSKTLIPQESALLNGSALIHLSFGSDNAGKQAYVFMQNYETKALELKQVCVINEIGNIAIETNAIVPTIVLFK